eukprot:572834-Prorocentrum_minimum.AAC.1
MSCCVATRTRARVTVPPPRLAPLGLRAFSSTPHPSCDWFPLEGVPECSHPSCDWFLPKPPWGGDASQPTRPQGLGQFLRKRLRDPPPRAGWAARPAPPSLNKQRRNQQRRDQQRLAAEVRAGTGDTAHPLDGVVAALLPHFEEPDPQPRRREHRHLERAHLFSPSAARAEKDSPNTQAARPSFFRGKQLIKGFAVGATLRQLDGHAFEAGGHKLPLRGTLKSPVVKRLIKGAGLYLELEVDRGAGPGLLLRGGGHELHLRRHAQLRLPREPPDLPHQAVVRGVVLGLPGGHLRSRPIGNK